jgi:hypothetical protein
MAVRLDETAQDITIENLHITESGGDGIFIFGATNVHVSNCLVDKHYRQGMSIISANGVLVEGSTFADTNGTEPAAGIDIEPDIDIHGLRPELSKIIISNCSCINNAGGGLLMNLASLNSSTPPISISIESLLVDGQMQHGPGLTIGNVRSVAGVIDIVESRVENTRGCGLAIYKKEAIQTQVLLDTVSFQNVAQGYPLGPVHPRRACDPTGACNPIIIVGGTDKLNAPEAAMGGIAFEGPCVIHDRLDRPFLRADQNAVFALEQVRGSFEVFNPFGCSVMVQKNQTGVSLDTRCHNDSVDMIPSKSDDGSAGAGSSVVNYPFIAQRVDKPGSPWSHDVDALERALHLVTSWDNASYARVAASAGMEGAGGRKPLEPWAPQLHNPAIVELKMDGGKVSSPGVGNGNIMKSGNLQRRPLWTTTLFASGSCDTRGVCYSCFRIPSIIVLDTRTVVAFVEARGNEGHALLLERFNPLSCIIGYRRVPLERLIEKPKLIGKRCEMSVFNDPF